MRCECCDRDSAIWAVTSNGWILCDGCVYSEFIAFIVHARYAWRKA